MVKIAIAGASSQLARELLDKLVESQRHEILGLMRSDPAGFPSLPGVKYAQTDYSDKDELVRLLKGVHTVLCVFIDPTSELQKRLIDACVEAGVKRYAPGEWATGASLEAHIDVIPWYQPKVDIAQYLRELNKDKKVLEYSRFQVGSFMHYLVAPHRITKYTQPLSINFDLENRRALVIEGSLDEPMTFTAVEDIAGIVARAVEYEGEWPEIGGIAGDRLSNSEILKLAEQVRGAPLDIEWLKLEDLEAGQLKATWTPTLDHPAIPKDQVEYFSKYGTQQTLIAQYKGLWDVSDEWNKIFPDYKFTKTEELVKRVWPVKA